jgi:hypothetical protein
MGVNFNGRPTGSKVSEIAFCFDRRFDRRLALHGSNHLAVSEVLIQLFDEIIDHFTT